MSHSIIPFTHSNIYSGDFSDKKFYILKEEPVYKPKELFYYSFKQYPYTFSKMDIADGFGAYFSYNSGKSLNMQKRGNKDAQVLYESGWRKQSTHSYSNLNEYPELKNYLEIFNDVPSLTIYGETQTGYQLSVWNSQAYVVTLSDKVTSYHIDLDYNLQEGDHATRVIILDDNFIVHNDGDVYSVVMILKN
jgi:hypothetical protein